MKNIKFEGKEMDLLNEVNLKNKKLNFSAYNQKGENINIAEVGGGIKVISTFPKLNTSVCDNQTIWLSKFAPKYEDVSFVSITMDDVDTIKKWCVDHEVDNLTILSDSKNKEFSNATNLLIPELNMLARGFIVLNQDNDVIASFFKEELTEDPEFEKLEDFIKTNS